MNIAQILFLTTTYLIAAIPFGLLLTKIFIDKDIRKEGSKNIGATNVTRIAGKKLGLATLILDASKGAIMIIIARIIFKNAQNLELILILSAGIAVIAHIYPIYLKFKGGKGVATTIAVIIALNPFIGLIVCLVWVASYKIFRISSISSLLSTFSSIIASFFTQTDKSSYILNFLSTQTVLFFVLFILILIRHKTNISRLIKGQEKQIK